MTALIAIRLTGLLMTLAIQPMPPANPVPQPQPDPAYAPQSTCSAEMASTDDTCGVSR